MAFQPPELQGHLIPDTDLSLPEYCFKVETDFSEAPKTNQGVATVKKIITALLNTSGGIIIMESLYAERLREPATTDWVTKFTEQLRKFIPQSVVQTCIRIVPRPTRVFIEVSRSTEFITIDYHLYIRFQAVTYSISEANCVRKVMTRKEREVRTNPFIAQTSLTYNSTAEEVEGQNVEYKYWDVKNLSGIKSRLKDERTIKSFFAFANLPPGGFVVIGVKEDERPTERKCIIYGQILEEDHEAQLRSLLEGILAKATFPFTAENLSPRLEWNMTFIPVLCGPDDKRRRLIVIQMKYFPGGVFMQSPESYQLSEDGLVLRLSIQQWLQLFEVTKDQFKQNIINESESDEVHSNDAATPSVPIIPEKTSYKLDSVLHQTNEVLTEIEKVQPSDHSINEALRQVKALSWTQHTHNWNSNLVQVSLKSYQNVMNFILKSQILRPTIPVTFTPDVSTIISSCQYPANMDKALNDIQHSLPDGCSGFAIASSKWVSNLQHNTSIAVPGHHILDVFMVDKKANIHLWSLIDPSAPESQERASQRYCLLSGRITKRVLCSPAPYQDADRRIVIHCHLYKLGVGELVMHAQDDIAECFFPLQTTLTFVSLQLRVASALLSKKTLIKEHLGREQEIFMTSCQMEHLLNSDLNQFNYFEGPPGCGKSYLALRIADNYPKNSVGYVCTTIPYEAFLVYQNCCMPILLQSETELMDAVHSGRLDKYRCLIIDDIHNISCSELSWLHLFERVRRQPNTRLFLFADSRYQSFKYPANMTLLKKCMHDFCERHNIPCHEKPLTVIHRNSKKVVSFLKCCISDEKSIHGTQLATSSQEDGDDVEIYYIKDILDESPENQLVGIVRELITEVNVLSGEPCSYEAKDIAILVDTKVAQHHVEHFMKLFRVHYKSLLVQNAGSFPITGLTIDTLDNFMGLDRRVCICITSKNFTESTTDTSGRTMSNKKYKAFVASRGISRVIFVVQKPLTAKLAKNLKLDKLPSKPVGSDNTECHTEDSVVCPATSNTNVETPKKALCLWHMERSEEICDLCFLRTSSGMGVLYITAIFKTQLVSLEGEPLELLADAQSIQNPVRTASFIGKQSDSLILTDRTAPYSWTVFSRQADENYGQKKNGIDGKIESVCWTPNGEIIMVVQKSDDYRLMRYTVGGWVVWDLGKDETQLRDPRRLSVGTDGRIYVPDLGSECVRVFDSHGRHERMIQPSTGARVIHYPRAVCVDSTGQWLFISHGVMSGRDLISVMSTSGGDLRKVIETSGRVWAIDLYQDKYLAVGTTWGLLLYDVSGEFWA